MNKRIETEIQSRFPEPKTSLPKGEYIDLIRGDEIIKGLFVKTDDPRNPVGAVNPDTGEEIELDLGEKLFGCARLEITPPESLTKQLKGPKQNKQPSKPQEQSLKTTS